jgi:topoisomerase-4 subunit B
MNFADQNKTKYSVGRADIETEMTTQFNSKLIKLLGKSGIARSIEKSIEERLYNENINTIKRASKQSKRKISDKFSPASKTKGSIYITEGLSAAGSVKQARDSEYEAVYALKGKVKNTRRLSDLTANKELLEIMSILDIEPSNPKMPIYEKIIIATDEDADGQHICSLIISFFYKWFPDVIKGKKLFRLITPLVRCQVGKNKKYFYTLEEYEEFSKTNKGTNMTYLKGLGSLNLDDWQHVMANKMLFEIFIDKEASKFLDIAFGDSSEKRKRWLQG